MKETCIITVRDKKQCYDAEISHMRDLGIDAVWRKAEFADSEEVIRHCRGYNYAITGTEVWDGNVFENLKESLKLLVRHGVGYESVDVEAATRNGIPVANLPGANAPAVAEMAVSLMLSVYRRIPQMNILMHQGNSTQQTANSLMGKTVGLLGMGNIAKTVVRLLQGFGCKILAYDVYHDESFAREYNVTFLPLKEVLLRSDVITVHMPMSAQTEGIINKDTIALMKRNAIIINTSRGGLIRSDDLADALKSGRILGAGLDVFENEDSSEAPMGYQFLGLENTILTPHGAGATFEIYATMMARAIETINCFRNGQPIPGLLNPDYIKYKRG